MRKTAKEATEATDAKDVLNILSILSILSLPLLSFGAGVGTTSGGILRLPVGAKASSLGDAAGLSLKDSSSIFYNPSQLTLLEQKSTFFSTALLQEGISQHSFSFGQSYKRGGASGVAINYLSYGKIEERNESGILVGAFGSNDLVISLAYARKAFEFPLGISLKYISSQIKNQASAFAVDLGFSLKPMLQDKLTLGLSLQNLGTGLRFQTQTDPLPLNLRLSSLYQIIERWEVALDILSILNENSNFLSLGTQYFHQITNTISITERLGYTARQSSKAGSLAGLSFGLGLTLNKLTLDYAFLPLGDLGTTHRFSLSLRF